jgi:hypothetical protein
MPDALISYPFTEEGLRDALEALGTTAENVGRNLLAMDFKGVREDPCRCPVARYLAAAVPDAKYMDVYRESVVAYVDAEAYGQRDPDDALFAVRTPGAVNDFIGQFDGFCHADLEVPDGSP